MFRHKKSVQKPEQSPPVIPSDSEESLSVGQSDRDFSHSAIASVRNDNVSNKKSKPESELDLRELLEKNLKWSQIIYEQNRKINRKLVWAAVAGWLRTIIIGAPIILALWYLPAFIDKFQATISGFTGLAPSSATGGKPAYSIEQLMQLLPLGDAEKAQLKAILK